MAPRSALANISFTVDSASEDDMTPDELDAMPTPDSNTETKAPARKARGKAAQPARSAPAAKATARGRPATRVAEAQKDAAAKRAPAKAGRKAPAGRRNGAGSDGEERADELDEDHVAEATGPVKPAKRGRPAKAKKVQEEEEPAQEEPAPVKRGRKPAAKEPVVKKEARPKTVAKPRTTKRGADTEAEPEAFTIPETQPEPDADAMDVEDSIEMEEIPESMPPPPRPSARRTAASRTRQPSAGARRAGSVSDTERDPAARRKVGDLTKKLEAMTARYETLKDAATSGKESSFEQLRKRTEQAAKDQDAVIKALKQHVSDLQARTADITTRNKEIASLTKTNAALAAENKKLADSLNTAQKENTTLNTKLAAARSSTQQETKVPGSAMKSRTTGVVLPGSAEAAKDAMLQKQKVEMYCDLTNLVIVAVKKNDDDEDVYDCLQTGRNGTLHFHLTVSEGSESYADTEFVYQPLLDEQRDRELLDLLPDYLTEEICFPRAHAARFFSKVVDSMSKRIVLEDEE
ncbi:uncharacterized protein EKO05_0010877 [Ascochyta rabiei]|uniref:Uncharacterized protein n=1 Tax=Didymella rabiei TaxID=5454 RepID=A0A163F9W3_DIDRA|nr:uncharacterized protein EKO05_0010877 [Ascochyta rabiei]KZM24216.1 hypothetical protein ST47_g4642 [Ascochyta rabiei]UPX20650.1 hypothetical protein EKO05_0010877 [Ascochyta rabiei]